MFTIKYRWLAKANLTLVRDLWSGLMNLLLAKNALTVLLFGLFLASLGCDYYHKATPMNFQLSKVQLVSAFPAKMEGDTVVRKCKADDEAEGMLLYLNMLSLTGAEAQQDLSIRPGDAIKVKGSSQRCIVADRNGPQSFIDICEVTEDSVALTGECIERYPDHDLANATYECKDLELGACKCQGQCPTPCELQGNLCQCPSGVCPGGCTREGKGISVEGFGYSSYLASENGDYGFTRDGKVGRLGVAILIDMSGSTKGFVDDQNREVLGASISSVRGSDPNAARATAVKQFLNSLDSNDKSIVFVFGEYPLSKTTEVKGAKVLCFDARGGTPEGELRKRCFSTDRSLVLSKHTVGTQTQEAEIDRLQKLPETGSRANLWSAVKDVYTFMKNEADTEIKHIIVINDGPDTCDPTSPYFIPYIGNRKQFPCGEEGLTFASFRDQVEQDISKAGKPQVIISFIQFQALGYKERDPRQMEIACLTGGHYIFINSLEPNSLEQTELEDALKDAILKLRYALIGSWALYFRLPELKELDKGAIYSFRGEMKLREDVQGNITKVSEVVRFTVGMISSGGKQIPLDLRPTIRLPCHTKDECKSPGDSPPTCKTWGCGIDTGVCEWVNLPDNTSCGDGMVCCNGYCSSVSECK